MSEGASRHQSTARIEAFSDGVIAIIVTIMVLELHAPAEAFASGDFNTVLATLGPKLLVYALSFLVVAIMLLNHHMLMRAATHATNALYWWNAYLLFWMSLIPLATDVLGDAPFAPMPVGFYGAILTMNAMGFTFLHRSAACIGDKDGVLDDIHREVVRKNWVSTMIYASTVPLAFVSPYISLAIFVIIPLLYFIPEFTPRLHRN